MPPPLLHDARVRALSALRDADACVTNSAQWDILIRSIAQLAPTLQVADIPAWSWDMLPAPAPSRAFFRFAVARLVTSLSDTRAEPQAAEPASSAASRATTTASGYSLSFSPWRGMATAQRQQFLATLAECDPGVAVAELRAARTAPKTKETYQPAVPLYLATCVKANLSPWPPSEASLEIFVAYLKKSKAYLNPEVYFWAIVDEAKTQGAAISLSKAWISDTLTALQRGLAPQEQAEPLSIPILRALGRACTTDVDFNLVLSLVCAIFSVARADSFIRLKPAQVKDVAPGRVQVTLGHMKGERRREELTPVFESLPVAFLRANFPPLFTPLGEIPLDPVRAFRALRERAVKANSANLAICPTARKMLRRLADLLKAAGIQNASPGRRRAFYTLHSTRVAAVCYLLKAGLAETAISTLANWTSDQIQRYGRRMMLDPELVDAFPFYNPVGMAGLYPDWTTSQASPGKRRKR
jgi:hypothetical protein